MSQTPEAQIDHTAQTLEQSVEKSAEASAAAAESAAEPVKEAASEAKQAVEEKLDSDNVESHCEAGKNKAAQILDNLAQEADKVKASTASAAKRVANEAERAADSAKDIVKKTADSLNEELKDPAVSTTVLLTVLTASAASTYLSQQHKQGLLTPVAATVVVLGTAAVAFAEYWGVKAYFDRKASN